MTTYLLACDETYRSNDRASGRIVRGTSVHRESAEAALSGVTVLQGSHNCYDGEMCRQNGRSKRKEDKTRPGTERSMYEVIGQCYNEISAVSGNWMDYQAERSRRTLQAVASRLTSGHSST